MVLELNFQSRFLNFMLECEDYRTQDFVRILDTLTLKNAQRS